MKILKIIGIVVLVILLIFVTLGIIGPDKAHIERSITIKGDKQSVLNYAKSFKTTYEWTPWLDADKSVKITLGGADGEVGSSYEWDGNDEVGSGKQTIKTITDSSAIIDLNFIRPFESSAVTFFKVKSISNDSTQLSWGFDSEYNFMSSAMSVVMDFESMMNEQFDKGLGRIKKNLEK